ncbi:hypothetical protein [Lignipirellula cremea]|uniref:hypothetical protein n=1 Tax=Lignipirellula cremea TaxID=2528010 RepID=UPI0011A47F18|nr:hypothetical protein [Lignipirellula cremea]
MLASIIIHASLAIVIVAIPVRYFLSEEASDPVVVEDPVEAESDAPGIGEVVGGPLDPFSQESQDKYMEEHFDTQLAAAVQQAEKRGRVSNRTELTRLTKKLNRISSDEAVDQISNRVNQWSAVQSRAAAPSKNPIEGAFDFDTAQVHDVVRQEQPDGSYTYTSILIDSAGRLFETELSQDEGRNLYSTMRTLQDNPLLERVYRQMAMPLLDKLLAAQEQLEAAGAQKDE